MPIVSAMAVPNVAIIRSPDDVIGVDVDVPVDVNVLVDVDVPVDMNVLVDVHVFVHVDVLIDFLRVCRRHNSQPQRGKYG